ncbi:MAG: polysaccharide deacetylase family protein [Candidatus Dormibacteraceae bacterium]
MNTKQEPWQWDESVWRGHVELVRAGRSLTPKTWPNGARAAVAVSFDSDHETIPLRDSQTSPGRLAQGEYGARTAIPRILRLLDRHRIPATFFIPAVSALLHPSEIRDCVAAGHEVGAHGWIHERTTLLPAVDEERLARQSLDTLEELGGVRPVGIRTPSWDFSTRTLDIIADQGLLYDSSLMADDEPYELVANGRSTGIVEIPVEWIRDDAVYYAMDRYTSLRPYTPPSGVLEVWRREFDGAYSEGGLFQLTLHPHVSGHRSRIIILDELLGYITTHRDVWYATHAQVAEYVRAALPSSQT